MLNIQNVKVRNLNIAPPPWTPAEMSTLAWYDASDTSTVSLATGVSAWNDKSGNNRHITQSTAGNQPSYINNNVISFNGSTNTLENSNAFMYANNGVDMFIVGAVTPGDQSYIISELATTSVQAAYNVTTGYTLAPLDTSQMAGQIRRCWTSQACYDLFYNVALSPVGAFDSTTKIYQYSDTVTYFSGRVNAGTATGASYSRGGPPPAFDLFGIGGMQAHSRFVTMSANEIVITDDLSDNDRYKMEGYLAWKWGLQGSLPSDHLYKNSRPTV